MAGSLSIGSIPAQRSKHTCRRFIAAPGPAISMAASMTEDSRKGAVHSTILLACGMWDFVRIFCCKIHSSPEGDHQSLRRHNLP